MTTRDGKGKRKKNYFLVKKVPAASLRRISKRPYVVDAFIVRLESEETPKLTKKSA
jgi:hypothetical protein